ncbi:MAG: TorD/DmsD family molecular chaperone [Anaerolineae bacterium]
MDEGMNWATEKRRLWLATLRGLARGFTYPDARWVATLLDGQWPSALAEVLKPLGFSADEVRQAIETLPADPAAALQALQVEYTYLFINAVPHVPAPPYASAYMGQGLLMGEPAETALRTYRRAGLTLAEDYHDLPDHLAAEMEFLAWLGEQALEAHEAGDEEQAREWVAQQKVFWRGQMQPWLAAFCQRVEEAARIPFYRALARLAEPLLSVAPTLILYEEGDEK